MSPDFSKNFATQATVDAASKSKGSGSDATMGASPASTTSKKGDIRYFLSVVVFALAIVATGAGFGVNAFFNRQIGSIEAGIAEFDKAFKFSDIEGILLLDRQVETLKNINFSRGGYSFLLKESSDLVVPGVYYTSVSISVLNDANYSMEIRGLANSLDAYYRQLRSFISADGVLEGTIKSEDYSLQRSEGQDRTSVLFTVTSSVPVSKVIALFDTS